MVTPEDIRLDDQVALVTAGANGLGEGIAMSVARFGGHVAILDIDAENGERVASAIRQLGREALFQRIDLSRTDEISGVVAQVASHFGRIDILANNVGGTRPTPFLEQSERSWHRHIDLNLISMLAATRAAVPVMIKAGRGGVIINVASIEGLRAAPAHAVYAACKAGMISFTRSMALELSAHGIRVHALAPDMIMTAGMQRFFDSDSAERLAARDRYIPLGRPGTVEEFGAVAVFLASKMAAYLNGVTIPVDGGTLASSGWSRGLAPEEWSLYHG